MNFGSGNGGEWTFLDLITLVSFFIGIENLESNMNQTDKQELQQNLAEKSDTILSEIHKHLEEQDQKIDLILERLNEKD